MLTEKHAAALKVQALHRGNSGRREVEAKT